MIASYLDEASEILESVKGKPQSVLERKRLAIELAALMLKEAANTITPQEKTIQEQLSRLMCDPVGKAFTMAMTDECFRSSSNRRVADQMTYLLNQMGIPHYLDWVKRSELFLFKALGPKISQFLVPLATRTLRKETTRVILPGEMGALTKHLHERRDQGIRLNLNHLGEAILSEAEAKKRLHIYMEDLKNPNIDYISVKISTIYSQINLLAFDETIEVLSDRLRQLYRAAMKHKITDSDGTKRDRFINLDMEEYRDLRLTVTAFRKVLDEPEFLSLSAGIVLQAYLPDSFSYQKELTEWAKKRVREGGAWVKIRIVKGANLAMEQFEASLKGWPQAPYTSKMEVDANYKRMVSLGCLPENARAVHLGVASHNLFDLAFAMLLRLENQVEPYVGFEMLEGMADHIRRVVQKLTGSMLLYCPVATKHEFQHAIAYLIRRLDENTGPENFLRHAFGLKPGTDAWEGQTTLFSESCEEIDTVSEQPRRTQNRQLHPIAPDIQLPFENEPDTDFSLPQNQRWAEELANHWKNHKPEPLPLVINGKELHDNQTGIGYNPSNPGHPFFHYAKASQHHLEEALAAAKAHEKEWAASSLEHRSHLLHRVAQKLRERRGELIGIAMLEGGKTIPESDPEVSEAIDFAEYYRKQMEKFARFKDLRWQPKGTILVTPPWNFPISIPAGGILAALSTGNCVLFKPASSAVLIGCSLANALWDAGIPKEVLQFIPCSGEESGSHLIQDPRVNCVILTGGTATAKKFLKMRPGLDLAAETGGKNSFIITALSDRDLAIKDLLHSAFGHAGQKCSAASLAILEAEVYDDPHFRRHLREAAASLKVGPAWDLSTRINPLIHEPQDVLKRGLTTLEDGEEWLLEPAQDPHNPNLWSPGIKMGVRPGGFTHMTELFGPVLGLMRADNLQHAIHLANAVPYGLTAGLQSLDQREQALWTQEIEAGNLYINRTITGAIVRRQPFGGTKASSFGNGSKAGGPNYLREFMKATQVGLPQEKHPVNEWVNSLTAFLEKIELTAEQLGLWTASVSNYAYWWKRLRQDRDPSKIVGQDNFFRYVPRKEITLRLSSHSSPLDALRSCAAALTCGAQLEISWSSEETKPTRFNWLDLVPVLRVIEESEEQFIDRIRTGKTNRIRLLETPSQALLEEAAESAVHIIHDPVLANGRLELLHYLREISLSADYHRYGNLGLREGELRKPIL
ncbi:MAG TPA: bifunctional proline dehydrogenase/L-glutamate gamma-semialdehyde dehydrogenase [Chlamydiales bacterium]|nr:bifunctional proline dehydrogenase/L-glutamate gamma-semialdehyde dehydrogenase [Chlamydiales bacterium]